MCSLNISKRFENGSLPFLQSCVWGSISALSYPKMLDKVWDFLLSRPLILNSTINHLLSRISENTSVFLLVEATLATKNPQQNKTEAHWGYKLRAQAVRPWNCLNCFGRETVLREASGAKRSGINPLSLSVMKTGIISLVSRVPSSSACCLLLCSSSAVSRSRSCPLGFTCHCSAFQALK